eukprot:TRINITY_DN8053_c0_g1_i6.p1 TRINITY_DN8053_c0_g1~~TRINITY_DN8053_c0_g1_i6.p1  ORF type:complete len:379 (-),score=66.16 TRINITY_DN8053_c0_g1_i6:305-1441(-)
MNQPDNFDLKSPDKAPESPSKIDELRNSRVTTGVFATDIQRGFIIFIAFILLLGFEHQCEEELGEVRENFIALMTIFYLLLLINTLIRKTTSLTIGFATIFQSFATYGCAILAGVALQRDPQKCNARNSLHVILCYGLIIYAVVKLIGDIVSLATWCSGRISPRVDMRVDQRSCLTGFMGYRGDNLAGVCAFSLIMVLLYFLNTEECNEVAMATVHRFVFVIGFLLVGWTILTFAGGPITAWIEENTDGEGHSAARGCALCLMTTFQCIFFTMGIALLIFYAMLMINFFSLKNDCREKAPFIEFFMAYVTWLFIALFIAGLLLFGLYWVYPNVDTFPTHLEPDEEEESLLVKKELAKETDSGVVLQPTTVEEVQDKKQ